MRLAFLLLSLITAVGAKERLPSDLAAGRYDLKVAGFMCTTCGRAMEQELSKLPELEAVSFDFDSETVTVTVKLDQRLKLSAVRRALSRAAKRVNIGNKLQVVGVLYRP